MSAREHALTWSTGAMTPEGFALVCHEVDAIEQPSVVECGSGFSTLQLAAIVHRRGGTLISLEHDELWAARVRRELAAAGLTETADVVLAPLAPHPLGRGGLHWYSESALRSMTRPIDFLLVDGPPAFDPGTGLSRYPALPGLAQRLSPDAVVVLDDIDRAGEQEVLRAWERESDFQFDVHPKCRIAIGHRRSAMGPARPERKASRAAPLQTTATVRHFRDHEPVAGRAARR